MPRVLNKQFVDGRGLSTDRLIHLSVRGELRRGQRRNLIGRRGHHPVVGATAAAFCELIAEPIPCKVPAAAANASGCVVTYDMPFPPR